jgi:uncharacterized OB-fold protein|tara:strand:- start:1 stop:420 length:420 start_codon:yes stop_codon:yes gene_type:complete
MTGAVMTPAEVYRAALDERRLTFQRCTACGHSWMPASSECPECWSPGYEWETAKRGAIVVSWVTFHVAFDPRYKGKVPYNVALLDLYEGPRMVSNIINIPASEDIIGRQVTLIFEQDMGRALPRFLLQNPIMAGDKSVY